MVSILFGAVVTAAICYAAWPGYMSYDSLNAYEQSLYGIQTMLWPPLHAYMFTVSRAVGADVWGLLVFQTFTLFTSAALVIHILVRDRRLAALLCLCFALSFPYVTPQLGTVFAHWRDVPTAGFALMSLAFWLLASRHRSAPLLVCAVISLGAAVALRYNAFLLVFGLLALMIWRPYLEPPRTGRARLVVIAATVLVMALAGASTRWRLPDLIRMPAAGNLSGTQQFDLIGISACADRNFLPSSMTPGVTLTPRQIRQLYDPRHLQMSLMPKPGLPPLLETNAGGEIGGMWLRAIQIEPGCYVAHRAAVLVQQMGMAAEGPFYVSNGGISPNTFGLKLAHPRLAMAVDAYVVRNAVEAWRRPYLLYVLALGLALAAGIARRGYAALFLALIVGVMAYPALLVIAAPAADARYIFPSSTLAALIITLASGLLFERYLAPRLRRGRTLAAG